MRFGKRKKEKGKKRHAAAVAIGICILAVIGGIAYKAAADRQTREAWANRIEREKQQIAEAERKLRLQSPKRRGIGSGRGCRSRNNVFEMVEKRPDFVELTETGTESILTVESLLWSIIPRATSCLRRWLRRFLSATILIITICFALRVHNDQITEDMFPIEQKYKRKRSGISVFKARVGI